MEILRYITWVWRNWEAWQKSFVVATILCLSSVLMPAEYKMYSVAAGMSIVWVWLFKWWFVDSFKKSYEEYKKQRDDLFNTIKGK